MPLSGNNIFNLYKIKAYQTPNLFKMQESKISTTTDTSVGSSIDFLASNLYQNLETKSSNAYLAYIADKDGITADPIYSRFSDCFMVTYETISA